MKRVEAVEDYHSEATEATECFGFLCECILLNGFSVAS